MKLLSLAGNALLYGGAVLSLAGLVSLALPAKGNRYALALRSLQAGGVALLLSTLALLAALLSRAYGFDYVAQYVNDMMHPLYVLSALWAGQEGSMLFWCGLLSAACLYLSLRGGPLQRGTLFVLLSSLAVFAMATALVANPFGYTDILLPRQGGMNPLLMNVWMVIHPPVLYFGYVFAVVPLAFLVAKEPDFRRARSWALLSVALLGFGVFLGGRWAYVELGWGGVWAWDPVENASFIPWLAGLGLVHVLRKGRGEGVWPLLLAFLFYGLCILGTYISRSGILSSVHAFASSGVEFFLIVLMFVLLLTLVRTWKRHAEEEKPKPPLTTDWWVELGVWLLITLTVVTLFGTFLPLLSKGFTGKELVLTPERWDRVVAPLFGLVLVGITFGMLSSPRKPPATLRTAITLGAGALLALVVIIMGKTPLVNGLGAGFALSAVVASLFYLAPQGAGLKGFVNSLRSYRRLGAAVAHIGFGVAAAGMAMMYGMKEQGSYDLSPGQTVEFGGYSLTYQDYNFEERKDHDAVAARIEVDGATGLTPEKRLYSYFEEPIAEVDILPSPLEDLYATLVSIDADGNITVELMRNRFIQLVWVGPVVAVLGFLLAGLTRRRKKVRDKEEKETE